MASPRKRFAQAVLSLAMVLPAAGAAQAQTPPAPNRVTTAITRLFNVRSAPVNDAPAYEPNAWNDAPDERVEKFYSTHQDQLAKVAKIEGRLYIWPLAQVLYKNTDQQMHAKYGLTLAEAKEFRAAFDVMTAGRQLRNNCYSYAINHPDNPPGWKLSPGEKAGLGIAKDDKFRPKTLTHLVEADGLLPAGQDPVAKKGYYLVAMFVIPGDDFHFVRQNNDGTWSHKPGDEEVTNLDFKDKRITDPKTANLGDYKFVSYFYVPEGGLKFIHPMHLPPAKPKPHHTQHNPKRH